MKKVILSLFLSSALIGQALCHDPVLKRGDLCRVVSGPFAEALTNKTITLKGTCKEIYNIESVESLLQKKGRPVNMYLGVLAYLRKISETDNPAEGEINLSDIPEKYRGVFYLGHTKEYVAYCLHPSWLEKIDEPENES